MNKNDIIKEYNLFINKFNLKPEEFILGAGAACLMHGLRKTTDDMDTAISTELFDKLLESKKYKLHYFGDIEVLEYNKSIDLHRLLFKPETIIIETVCCYSAKELLKQKQKLNRPKDQNDIKLLKELINNNSYLKAIIIKGNPKYINNSIAIKYYHDIEKFLKENGIEHVTFDSGDDGTLPKLDADLYIAHSRGCGRFQYMPEDKKKVFLKFGVPDGIIDPVDLKWVKEVWEKDTDKQPPKEHFIFIKEQKEAILNLIKKVKNVSLEDLTDLITIPQEILDRANEDPILSGYINSKAKRVGIYFEGAIVGFYSPCEEAYLGKQYWRTGNIYILPEYRNKGLASKTIIDFFADKLYGLAHIAENNPSSLKAFENAGFKNLDILPNKNPKGKSLYLLIKNPTNLKPAFVKW